MSSKGTYFSKTLTIISQQKVIKKKVVMTFRYQFATKLHDKNDESGSVEVPYPFATKLDDRSDEFFAHEVWKCWECSKYPSEDCGCNKGFEKSETKMRNGY